MTWIDTLVAHCAAGLDERVREALSSRGVSDEQIDQFQLGYLDQQLPDVEYPRSFLEWSGAGTKLDDVLVLPLTNTRGQLRGLQFRHVALDRKGYMDFIEDKTEPVLFGLGQAAPHIWEGRSVFLVEGAFDLFPVQRFYPASLATLTARVVDPFIRVLRRLVDEIWIGYDMDDTGQKAAKRFIQKHATEFKRVQSVVYPRVEMPGGKLSKDPSDLWETWGDARFQSFLKTVLSESEPFYAKDL
jgi:DNA primase